MIKSLNLINNEIKAISGGKGLVGSLIGLAVSAGSKKIISEIKKNLGRHSGRYCYGKIPYQTFQDSKKLAFEKNMGKLFEETSGRLSCMTA